MREAEDSFYLVSAGTYQRLDHDWIHKWMPKDGTVQYENLTNSMGVLVVSGPKARQLMQRFLDQIFQMRDLNIKCSKHKYRSCSL